MADDAPQRKQRGERKANHGGARGSALRFGRAFVRKPAMLGSVVPSSRYLVRRMLRPIDWERAEVVVEYGPGVGTCTTEILRRLRPDGRLLAFETHAGFVRHLEGSIRDPRLEVIHGSAEDVQAALANRGLAGADYVLSGVPFSLMPDEVRDTILVRTRDLLRPGGAMLVYQFAPTIAIHLNRVFEDVDWGFEPRNFPPAVVFRCRERA